MKRVTRFSAILLAIMLALASISRDHSVPLLKTVVQDTEGQFHTTYLSEKKQGDVYNTHRQYELRISPLSSLPAPDSKIQPVSFLEASFFIELRRQMLVSHYLARSKEVSPSLTAGVIIYPFHYFW